VGILIDSSSLIAAERGELDLEAALAGDLDDEIAIAAISASELLHGLHRLKGGLKQARAERFVERLLDTVPVIPFDLDVARVHARIGAELAAKGRVHRGGHRLQRRHPRRTQLPENRRPRLEVLVGQACAAFADSQTKSDNLRICQ
jgi:predicted nucleic acid-binding protein